MKHVLLLIGLLTSLAATAACPPRHPARPEAATAATPDSVRLRAAACTRYLTDALRLSNRQALAVQRCATQQAAAPTATWPHFAQQMQRILSPGQYGTFVALAERLPR